MNVEHFNFKRVYLDQVMYRTSLPHFFYFKPDQLPTYIEFTMHRKCTGEQD